MSAEFGEKLTLTVTVLAIMFLVGVPAVSAQITPVGTDDAFDVATWNIEWFGDNGHGPDDEDLQLEMVLNVIRESKIEFWALQEISDRFQFTELVDSLGGNWVGQLATISGQQKIAFLYDTDRVRLAQPIHVLSNFSYEFAGRPPLRLTTDILLPDTTVQVTLFTIHMKCCGGSQDKIRRHDASLRLKTHADGALPDDRPVIILGDYNDQLISSISGGPTPYQNFLDDPQHYLFASTEIDSDREYTWCRNLKCTSGSTLDHIVVSNELFTHLVDLRAYRMHSVLDTYPNFINEASDHIPVYASFRFPTSTAIESVSEAPKQLQIQSIFPNPATDLITVNYRATNASSRAVQVHIIDVLGRQITVPITTSSSGGRIQINTSGLSPGLYVIRISDGQHAASSRFVKGL